jgi:hypothetical protein
MKKEIKNIQAMVKLLEDPDQFVYDQVYQNLLRTGVDYINTIQTLYDNDTDELRKERLALILDELKLLKLVNDISFWKENYPSDLLEGLLSIARYGYPNLDVVNRQKRNLHEIQTRNLHD